MQEFFPAFEQEFTLVCGLRSTRAMFMSDGPRGKVSLFIADISVVSTLLGGRIDLIGDEGVGSNGIAKFNYKISYKQGIGMLVSYALQVSNILDIVSGRAEPIAPETKESVCNGIIDARLNNMESLAHIILEDIEQVRMVLKEGR